MSDLKPCPFCGSEAQKFNTGIDTWIEYSHDKKCPMRYSDYDGDTPEDMTAWNTRPIEDALRAELEAALAEIERLRKAAPGPFTVTVDVPKSGCINCPLDEYMCSCSLCEHEVIVPGPGCPRYKGGKE